MSKGDLIAKHPPVVISAVHPTPFANPFRESKPFTSPSPD